MDLESSKTTTVHATLRNASHTLVCLRYGIGDVVMQFPVLEALRQAVPDMRITAIGAAPATDLLDGSGFVDEVVTFGRWGIRHFWQPADEAMVSQLAGWLEEAAFDLVLDAEYAPQPIYNAVQRKGLVSRSSDKSALLGALAGGANSTEALCRATDLGWGLPVHAHVRPSIALSASEVEFARALLDLDHLEGGPLLIGLCTAASSALKRWPEQRFAAVADWAIANGHRAIVIEGDLDDGVPGMRRLMAYGSRAQVVRRLHLRHLAALLAECAALVCNDTGVLHMAAAVGTPVVAVFGPTSPAVYLPRGRTIGLAGDVTCPHRTHSMDPPGCWASEHCLIAPDNCTVGVRTETVISALQFLVSPAPDMPFKPVPSDPTSSCVQR